jgi:Xaa-Pro dipeptidase
MNFTKRAFLKASSTVLATIPLSASRLGASASTQSVLTSTSIDNITHYIKSINAAVRHKRIAKKQSLEKRHNIAALILEPGAAIYYLSGVLW